MEAPPGLGARGRDLWRAVAGDYELGVHERIILAEACRTTDLLDKLESLVVSNGLTVEGPQGMKANPAVVEVRQQRITLARLVAALRIPAEAPDAPRTQRRGTRGVYEVKRA
ncbi:hypothetical protein [Marmoricola sp. Leaf446]|uniref:hypothetical protein n=1 Tax=Marmoricola sp. Leaf446 TaxID=1736379 RepID=UPI001910FAC8|nr:hypothetical protein [Marmoricola sp. Leaf446]